MLSPIVSQPTQSIPALKCEVLDVKRFQAARHYSRHELQAIEHDPDLAVVIDLDHRRELLRDLALTLQQAGAITFHTEPESCPDSHDVLIATCYAAVNPSKH